MKIVGITPDNPYTMETPEHMYLRLLRNLGHEVMIGEHFDHIPHDVDVVAALSEVSCELAYKLATTNKLPFYAHMEWIPVWRVFKEPESQWGMERGGYSYVQKMNFVRIYQRYCWFWNQANVKTLAANCFINHTNEFLGIDTKASIKYLGADLNAIKEAQSELGNVETQNEVTCVARFVPHKRIHHVIKALQMIRFNGTLNLVGYGPEADYYKQLAGPLKLEFVHSKDKYATIAKSKAVVALWSGIVPIEASYLNVPCLTYDSPYMRELFDNTLIYAKNNDIGDLAYQLSAILEFNDKTRLDFSSKLIKRINEKSINTLDINDAVLMLERLLIKAIDNKNRVDIK